MCVLVWCVCRKQREATNAQKNAQRAAMRAHFRRKYQLSEVGRGGGWGVLLPHRRHGCPALTHLWRVHTRPETVLFPSPPRTPRTPAACGRWGGSCPSPTSCPRSSIPTPDPRTPASACCAPSKASASARRRSPRSTGAGRPLPRAGGRPVRSCDPRGGGELPGTMGSLPSGCLLLSKHKSCQSSRSPGQPDTPDLNNRNGQSFREKVVI